MKRLTNARNRCVFCKAADEECAFAAGEFSAPCPDYKTYQRLSAIEDILGDDYDLDRLKELVEADKEGRCVVLPCKVGESVWEVLDVCNFPGDCHETQTCKGCEYREIFKEKLAFSLYMISRNGKLEPPYYVSEKEAEAALEKMKGGNE